MPDRARAMVVLPAPGGPLTIVNSATTLIVAYRDQSADGFVA